MPDERDSDPLTAPPMAVMPVGDGDWGLVCPADVEMYGFGHLKTVVVVWSFRMSTC